jgi:transcriptional regulator with XRE-family HTH domain
MASTSPKGSNHIDKHVGSRIRMRRLMLGMSQTDLADGVALTFQQIQKYENGINRVSASRMQQFAKILKVPISFFFEEAPPMRLGNNKSYGLDKSAIAIDEFSASNDGLAIMKAFGRITDHKLRHAIVALVAKLADNPSRRS